MHFAFMRMSRLTIYIQEKPHRYAVFFVMASYYEQINILVVYIDSADNCLIVYNVRTIVRIDSMIV